MKLVGGDEQFQRRINEDIKMVDNDGKRAVGSDGRPRSFPTIIIHEDLWPPQFVAGCKIQIENCDYEAVPVGDFVVARIGNKVCIVRLMGWRFINGQVELKYVDSPKAPKMRSSSSLIILGRVYNVVNPATGKTFDPNRMNIVDRSYYNVTGFGTRNVFVGGFQTVAAFSNDWFYRMKSKVKRNWSFFRGLGRIKKIENELKEKKRHDEMLRKKKRYLASTGRGKDIIEVVPNDEPIENEVSFENAKMILEKQSVEDWWIDEKKKGEK